MVLGAIGVGALWGDGLECMYPFICASIIPVRLCFSTSIMNTTRTMVRFRLPSSSTSRTPTVLGTLRYVALIMNT